MSMFTDDAATLKAYLSAQSQIIEREVNETTFPEILYPQLIPTDTSGNPFATSVLYLSSKQVGQADWIHGDADDVPMADAGMDGVQTPVYTAGIGYGYGWEELNQARQHGFALDTAKGIAARRAYEQMVNRIAFDGDSRKGFSGLIKNSAIPSATGNLSDWTNSGTTDKAIIGDVNKVLMATASDSTNPVADTLLLPTDYFTELTNRYQPNGRDNLLQYVINSNIYTTITGRPLTIRALKSLENVGNSKHRIIAYRRSPDVLKLHIPMPHRFLPVYQAGPLRFEVPGVFRIGGLNIRRPQDTSRLTEA